MSTLEGLFDFLRHAPTAYHATQKAAQLLEAAGFTELQEGDCWQLEKGKSYYVTRNQSSILAFRLPEEKPVGWHLAISHSDSPSWRIKSLDSVAAGYARAEVEGYGGMIMSTWLDRPLALAGRVICRTPSGLEGRIICSEKEVLVIPNQAIHMNRELNKGFAFNPQVDMQPIFGTAGKSLKPYLAKLAGVEDPEDIIDIDLNLVVLPKPATVGLEEEYFLSPKIDNLECAYTTLEGFLNSKGCGFWGMFDNEEVGSGTRQGAKSDFLPLVLARVSDAMGMDKEERRRARANSLLLSCDNAHAVHPNHPEAFDPDHRVAMNQGVVIKYNATEKYTTNGMTGGLVRCLCEKAGVPYQVFANRADKPGGSTLGNLLSNQLSVPMADIGLAQLAMHSAMETAGTKDPAYMAKLVQTYFDTPLAQSKDGVWKLGE